MAFVVFNSLTSEKNHEISIFGHIYRFVFLMKTTKNAGFYKIF